MAFRPAGISSIQTADAFSAQAIIELIAGAGRTIQVTEVGISCDGAANDTGAPSQFSLRRHTTIGTGGGSTAPTVLQDDLGTALDTTANQNLTGAAAVGGIMHIWTVPVVSGMIWVAAPGREVSQVGSGTLSIGVGNVDNLASGIAAAVYMVFEE